MPNTALICGFRDGVNVGPVSDADLKKASMLAHGLVIMTLFLKAGIVGSSPACVFGYFRA